MTETKGRKITEIQHKYKEMRGVSRGVNDIYINKIISEIRQTKR